LKNVFCVQSMVGVYHGFTYFSKSINERKSSFNKHDDYIS
jgi:hypothetical protein